MTDRPTTERSFETVIALHGVRRQEQRERIMLERIRDLERKLAVARESMEPAAKLSTHQDCPVENHGIVVAAMEALACIDGNDQSHGRRDHGSKTENG